MIITPRKGLYLPSRFRQRGIIVATAIPFVGAGTGTIQLTSSNNDTYNAFVFGTGSNPIAGWRANLNGNAESEETNTGAGENWVTTFTTPDWIVPVEGMDLFEIEATQFSQTGGGSLSGEVGLGFNDLGSTRTWTITRTSASAGVSQWVLDLVIREILDTGNSVSGRVTLEAEREVI